MATIARSVSAALIEANRLWPNRAKASDGTVGDPRHRQTESDHNAGARNLVHAFDLTHDPKNGPDCLVLSELLRQRTNDRTEKRVKYVIFNRRIYNPTVSPYWRTYGGTNAHTKHMHVSILSTPEAENDVSPWWAITPQEAAMRFGLIDFTVAPGLDPDDKNRIPFWGVTKSGAVYALNGAPNYGGVNTVDPTPHEDVVGIQAYAAGYVIVRDDCYQEPDGSWNAPTYVFQR